MTVPPRTDTGGGGAHELQVTVEPLTDAMTRGWDALAERTCASPFLRPGYVAIWRRAFAPDAPPPSVIGVRRGDDLVGALPISRDGGRIGPPGNFETVSCGIVAEDDTARRAVADTLLALGARRVSLDHVDVDGPTQAIVAGTAGRLGHRIVSRPSLRSPVVDTDDGWDAYWKERSRNLRHNVTRCRRRLEELGEVHVDVRRAVRPDELDELLAEGFAVEGSGWKTEEGTAILTDAVTRQYYTELSAWAARHGWLRPSYLRLDGRAIAFCLGVQTNGVFYALKLGYDTALSRFSPGTVLLHGLIRHSFDDGLARFDFAGRDEPYKLAWATGVSEQIRLDVFPPTFAGRAAHAAYRARVALAGSPLGPRLRTAAGWFRAARAGRRERPVAHAPDIQGRQTT